MKKNLYGIYGASGYGREVMPLARNLLENGGDIGDFELVFIDDNPSSSKVNGHSVLTFEEFVSESANLKYVSIAIANSKVREKLLERIKENSIQSWSIMSKNNVIMDECVVGENTILSPFVTLTSNITIGKSFHANIYSYVAHDCVIGDFVTFAPSVKCNGNVRIEDHVYVGTGAIIKQGKPDRPLVIGKGATIAAGAVVTKNVPEGVTVFGNPAVLLTKENLRKR